MTSKIWLQNALKICAEKGIDVLSAQVILEHVLDKSRVFLRTYPETKLNDEEQEKANSFLARRLNHEPLAYILGKKEFYGLDFKVNKHTLIPRPETELLVEKAIDFAKNEGKSTAELCIADIGTGSGCIGITLLKYLPKALCLALDISKEALEIAEKNAVFHEVEKRFLPVYERAGQYKSPYLFDIICSNPPYIDFEEYLHLEDTVVKYEPKQALTCDVHGMAVIEEVLTFAKRYLKPQGLLLIEHGYNQGEISQQAAKKHSCFSQISTIQDFNGNDRILRCVKSIEKY